MKKSDKLAKKRATRLTNEVELQLKRGLIHVELMDSPEAVQAFLEA
ncbi:hypothetical protein H9L19_06925 [Weissella diestrammenae]|uniref:Uncharacterized protein n=1 Tax=Weissella diestrammenae TaxID=1162633 RepID=A0A7G9T4S5_9LACO|nr:hypothetical protein [Weissella diestrammenae]MCM0582812.1 hypothetical protein [Weissella diestrammenae]QNN75100.1 hypothetical protein H9L19_06925 [Weissella diestrammenae]